MFVILTYFLRASLTITAAREALPSPPQLQAIALNRLDWSITRLQDDWISVQSDSVLDLRTNYTLMAWISALSD